MRLAHAIIGCAMWVVMATGASRAELGELRGEPRNAHDRREQCQALWTATLSRAVAARINADITELASDDLEVRALGLKRLKATVEALEGSAPLLALEVAGSDVKNQGQAEGQRAEGVPQEDEGLLEKYEATWIPSLSRALCTGIKADVEELDSKRLEVREAALKRLQSAMGLDFGFDPAAGAHDREKAHECWSEYASNLEQALNTHVPLLLARETEQNRNERSWAAMFLGERTPHPVFLSLLYAAVRSDEESRDVQYWAVTAISQIPHTGISRMTPCDMVEFLIEQLVAKNPAVATRAWEKLNRMTRARIDYDRKNPQGTKERFERWWAKNKGKFKYDSETRASMLLERS